MNKDEIIDKLENPGVVAIMRAASSDQLIDAARALIEGGVSAIEITMTTPNALQVIAGMRKVFGANVLAGVGTVLDVKMCAAAIEAGAEYVITPLVKPDVIAYCNEQRKPILAGCYTPTEAQTSYECGADFIKIFPSDTLGPKYVAALLAPLPHLKIFPTGGVTVDTAADFIRAGCVGVAAGSSLVNKEILKNSDWKKLKTAAADLVAAVASARASL